MCVSVSVSVCLSLMVYLWRYRCVLGATEIVSEIIQCKQVISKINEVMEGRETRLIEEMRKSSHS